MMTRPLYVGLLGYAGAGKDTAAVYLTEALNARGKRCETLALADPIRWMLSALGVTHSQMTSRELKEAPLEDFNGCSYRQMAQTLGTDWGRAQLGQGFWLSRLQARVAALREVGKVPDVVLVPDVRFANEADWIRQRKGLLVRVERPGLQPVRAHVSEGQQLPHDHVLHNDADISNLRARCAALSVLLMAEAALEA